MWRFYKEIILRSLADTPKLVSSNWVAVGVSIFVLVATFIFRVRRQQSYKDAVNWRDRLTAMRDHWLKDSFISVVVTTIAWVLLFAVSLTRTLYSEHQAVLQAKANLTDELATLRKSKASAAASPFAISFDDEYATIANTVQAFRFLMPQQSQTCWLRITAPRENRQVAQVLANLGATFCRVDAPYDPAEPDDEAVRGSIQDALLIHMKKTSPDRGSFVVALGNAFSVRRTYDLPSQFPKEMVWIQVGKGNPWRKDAAKPGTEN